MRLNLGCGEKKKDGYVGNIISTTPSCFAIHPFINEGEVGAPVDASAVNGATMTQQLPLH